MPVTLTRTKHCCSLAVANVRRAHAPSGFPFAAANYKQPRFAPFSSVCFRKICLPIDRRCPPPEPFISSPLLYFDIPQRRCSKYATRFVDPLETLADFVSTIRARFPEIPGACFSAKRREMKAKERKDRATRGDIPLSESDIPPSAFFID